MAVIANSQAESRLLQSRVTAAEWEQRINLAACFRLVAKYGWTDLTATHISASVPGEPDCFLVNPYPMFFDQVRASDLIKVGNDGTILSETSYALDDAAFTVHSAIHMARPDAMCIIHTHSVPGMALSSLPQGLLPLTQHALLFYNNIGYHDYEGIADDLDERDRLARDLAGNRALILRNHGLLTVGVSIPNAFKLMYYLEKSCEAQLAAMAASPNRKLARPTASACVRAAEQYNALFDFGAEDWPGLLISLDKVDESYRT